MERRTPRSPRPDSYTANIGPFGDLRITEDEVQQREEAIMLRHGWTAVTVFDVPGLWAKEWGGTRYVVELATALKFARREAESRVAPDQWPDGQS